MPPATNNNDTIQEARLLVSWTQTREKSNYFMWQFGFPKQRRTRLSIDSHLTPIIEINQHKFSVLSEIRDEYGACHCHEMTEAATFKEIYVPRPRQIYHHTIKKPSLSS